MICLKAIFPACLLLLIGATATASQTTIDLHGCSYFGEALPAKAEISGPTGDTSELIQRIVDASGLARNFEIRTAAIPNAAAVTADQVRLILYNPGFIDEIRQKTKNRWAAVGILAHEIGHHVNGHTLQSGGSRPSLELEADYFSGFVLQRLGARLTDANAVIEMFAPSAGGLTHPGKRDRLAAIAAGWRSACERDVNCPQYSVPDREIPASDDPGASTSGKRKGRNDVFQHLQ
jgi:hypothetical protein